MSLQTTDIEQTVQNDFTDDALTYYQQADERERDAMRRWLKELLRDNRIAIEFFKTDGSIRVMNCTLSEAHGAKYNTEPEVTTDSIKMTKKPRAVNNDVCRVWDCDVNAWRSFRWDRLKRIQFSIG